MALTYSPPESSVPTPMTPLEKMLRSFPDARQRPNGWYYHKDNPDFDFRPDDEGIIRIKSWTGRSAPDILAMGSPPLKLPDLYPRTSSPRKPQAPAPERLDLVTLSHYLKLPWQFLFNLGYRDDYSYHGRKVVKVGGYTVPDRSDHSKVRLRLALSGPDRFKWDEDTPGNPIPYGLGRLDAAREVGFLFIGEGESDGATMWFHGLPYLGIAGANSAQNLDVAQVAGIEQLIILVEPDQVARLSLTGGGFYASMHKHLRQGGYTGLISACHFFQATGYKDPSALHKDLWDTCDSEELAPLLSTVRARFAEIMQAAIAGAIPEGTSEEGQYAEVDVAALLDELARLRAENKQLRADQDWDDQLLALDNQQVSAAQKLVYRSIRKQSAGRIEEWIAEMQAWQLAPHCGLKEGAIYDALTYAEKTLQIIDRRKVNDWSSGELRTPKQVSLKEVFDYPHLYAAPVPRNHGGDRPRCKQCGEELDVYRVTYCRKCQKWEHKTIYEAPPDYEPMNPPVEGSSQIDHSEEPARSSQVDHLSTPIIGSQVDYSVPSKEDETGTDSGPYPPPDRASLCCNSWDWRWNPSKNGTGGYECGGCTPELAVSP